MTAEYWITGLVTAVVVVVAVMLHYEGLRLMSDRLLVGRQHLRRRRIVLMILALLSLHIVEVWIFGIAYYVLLQFDGFGALLGETSMGFFDCIYYSAAVYTTVGFGDIYPVGPIRTMTGTEAITGLTMITWSASYTFVEMLKTWSKDD
ncbi:MAG: potassium channel family protein [Woeseiaceae bacterium]|nr:potassium channel family protein [Woeseiaceae bacterium]